MGHCGMTGALDWHNMHIIIIVHNNFITGDKWENKITLSSRIKSHPSERRKQKRVNLRSITLSSSNSSTTAAPWLNCTFNHNSNSSKIIAVHLGKSNNHAQMGIKNQFIHSLSIHHLIHTIANERQVSYSRPTL